METSDDILRAYENADLQKRLHIYLQHRDLRPEFADIEKRVPPCPVKADSFRRKPARIGDAFGHIRHRLGSHGRKHCPICQS